MTSPTIPVLRTLRVTKACNRCGEPIVLVRLATSRAWMAFAADAVGPKRIDDDGVLVENLLLTDRHTCRSAQSDGDQVGHS